MLAIADAEKMRRMGGLRVRGNSRLSRIITEERSAFHQQPVGAYRLFALGLAPAV